MSNKNDLPLMNENDGIVLFHPHVPKNAKKYVSEVLDSRWIGQGPKVDEFESKFKDFFNLQYNCLSVGSGTDALHLAYLLAGIQKDDEVIVPLFTCTATTIPLLYIGAKPIMVDISLNDMNINVNNIRNNITKKTKAIVCVHYGGVPCNMKIIQNIANEFGLKVIEDAAHALGSKFDNIMIGNISDFTIFSFQAIKQITTGDGGMLVIKDNNLINKARRLRWFGIDRISKQKGIWENDITEVGYKYQMTDIAAAIGLAGLEEYNDTLLYRRNLFDRYKFNLKDSSFKILDTDNDNDYNSCWLCTIISNNYKNLQSYLRKFNIESGQTHYRNDRYSVFNISSKFPNMDLLDDKYLILPLHTKMTLQDVDFICRKILDYECSV